MRALFAVKFLLLMLICCLCNNIALAEDELLGENDPFTLDTVVVRADKMQVDVQSLPSSASVFSSDTVETRNIEETKDVFNIAPNMFFIKAGPDAHTGDSFASVRGITSFMSGAPVLGVYVDDVYIPGYEMPLFDLEKIEVLRGPQGTLYGRNSQAGVISIYTKPPRQDAWEGKIMQSYGSYNSPTTMGMVSGPITDKLSMRIAGQYEYTDGYFENSYNGSSKADEHQRWTGRGAFDWHPTDKFRLTFNLDGEAYDGNYAEFIPMSKLHSSDSHKVDTDWEGLAYKRSEGASMRAEWTFDGMKFLSITGIRRTFSRGDQDMDFTRADITRYYITTDNDMLTQEFRLQSVDNEESKFKWLLGSFLFREKEDIRYKYDNGVDTGMLGEYYWQKGSTDSRGFAVFGQGIYSIGPVDVTLGLRYDYENKDFDYGQYATPMMGMDNLDGSSDNSYGVWLPKAALSWHATENIMPYASVSRGYRGGGFNITQSMGKPYDPEYTWNYEAGIKTEWLDKTLKFNLAAFYIDWTDIQVMQPDFPYFTVTNAGKAVSKGIELDVSWLAAPGLELFGNFGYTHAKFTDYSDSDGDYTGNWVNSVPRFTATAGATYRFLDHFMISADYTAIGGVYFDQANTKYQSTYHLVNAKIGYEGDNWDVYLWAKNLFNEKYATRAFSMQTWSGDMEWFARPGDPLTVGMTVGYRF